MSRLLNPDSPYGPRSDADFLAEMNALTRAHIEGCPEYASIWPDFDRAENLTELPWLHVGLFKHIEFKTSGEGIRHERTLKSSATSSGVSSLVALDRASSELQSASTLAIFRNFVGDAIRPLLVLDSSRSLLTRGEVSARIAAALSLRPLASEIHFLLDDAEDPGSMKWDSLAEQLRNHDDLLVYGFTWILWLAWGNANVPDEIRELLAGKRIHFVHSGGWKKLEDIQVDRRRFDDSLLCGLHPDARVIDFYGLVEQVGIIYPLCDAGFRHAPAWADLLVRDPWTLDSLVGEPGQLQLMNTLAMGAPYHNVLTEDVGRIVTGDCPCGRAGKRFELLGRIPKAEVRGCANV
jgi:hypothetical protein